MGCVRHFVFLILILPSSLFALPNELPVSYVVNHCYWYLFDGKPKPRAPFSAVPMPREQNQKLVDFGKLGFDEPIPKHFVIGDGSDTRSLIEVDLREGSELSLEIQRIRKVILNHLVIEIDKVDKEAVIALIAKNVAHQVGIAKNIPFAWDKGLVDRPDPEGVKFHELPIDHEPILTEYLMPTVRLERFIRQAEAYCLGQALIAWILLRSFEIPSRLHLGATTAFLAKEIGHTSVELPDGRFVDPAGAVVIKPAKEPALDGLLETDWVYTPNYRIYPEGGGYGWHAWRFRYKRYPVLVIDD